MFKHLVGFVIFSFIVGLSWFASGFFYEMPNADSVYVYEPSVKVYEKRNCNLRKYKASESADIELKQAVFNIKTKRLDTSFEIKSIYADSKYVNLKLHFFAKDADGARYLATEDIMVSPETDNSGVTKWNESSSSLWLDNLNDYDNLYVIPDADEGYVYSESNNKIVPLFEEGKAFPVIIAGKN